MEEVRKQIVEFLGKIDLNEEHCFNTEDPSDYYCGNEDDARSYGYDAGDYEARLGLYNRLKDLMDLSGVVSNA